MKNSIKTKSALFLAMLLLLTVGILSYSVLRGVKSNQQKSYENILSQQARIANIYVNQAYATEKIPETDIFLKKNGQSLARQIGLLSGMQVILYNIKGEEVGNSFSLMERPEIKDTLNYSLQNNVAYQTIGESLNYLSPVNLQNVQIGVVQFNYSIKESNAFYRSVLRLFIVIGTIIFVLSFIIGYSYFYRLARDILKLKNIVEDIKNGIYEKIPILKRNDELMQLNKDIYFMSNQIQKNIKDMEEEQGKLRLAVEKLRILEKQQKHFIENITHEFKTPLTVIKAYVDLMEMYTDDPKLVEDAKENISKETQRLYEMVEKILSLAALEKYDFESKEENLEVREVLQEICNRMEGKIKKFELTLHTNLQEGIIYADRENMMQIFINLLDNAIKYNRPKGKIYINSYKKDRNLYIEVKDTGIGIPSEARGKVFEPFYRVDKHRSRETGGAGLGLALVKELVEKQNGTIKLLDNDEDGTTFQIMFPILL